MAGFIRRYNYQPGTEVITRIEGVIIIDQTPPSGISGVGSGTVCMVGEFADMGAVVEPTSSGGIVSKPKVVEIYSGQDLINKVGGFDATLGDFGGAEGNGFARVRGKRFSRLLIAPVNLCSGQGTRFWRQLPVCISTANPDPVVPVAATSVPAGTEIRGGAARGKLGTAVTFTARPAIASGTQGAIAPSGTPAATQNFAAASGFDWTTVERGDGTLGARKGDILVIGSGAGVGGALAPAGAVGEGGAGTYRVAADPASGTSIAVEALDGTAFDWGASDADVPWRLHHSTDADTAPEIVHGATTPGGYIVSEPGGYVVPFRPLTDDSGAGTDGTWAASTALTPQTAAQQITGTTAEPLSGFTGSTHPNDAMVFTAAIQGPNPNNSPAMDAVYLTALDATITEEAPASDINVIVSARSSASIRNGLQRNAQEASSQGRGRVTVIQPTLTDTVFDDVIGNSPPGVGATRAERVVYTWPGVRTEVREAIGQPIRTAAGGTTIDGILDEGASSWYASLLSVLAPERNPGQASAPVPEVFAGILGLQRNAPALSMQHYIQMRDRGVSGFRIDKKAGPIIQSGITSSLANGEKNLNRRRMADFIQDSIAERLVELSKELSTEQFRDAAAGEVEAFLLELLSPGAASGQRIAAYQVDDRSGNTPEAAARGIHVIISRVRTLNTADFIVLQTEIGESVVVTQLPA